jgi:hypothetical protein
MTLTVYTISCTAFIAVCLWITWAASRARERVRREVRRLRAPRAGSPHGRQWNWSNLSGLTGGLRPLAKRGIGDRGVNRPGAVHALWQEGAR